MEQHGNETHIETDEARGGSTPHIVRWILAISLLAAIVLLSIIWITGAATQSEAEGSANARNKVLDEYGAGGGILGENADEIEAPKASDTAPSGDATVEN